MVMREYTVAGEIENDHHYAGVSKAVGRLLHRQPAGAGPEGRAGG
ncbi:hypothetical protein [Streptomyces sp. NPDC087270]